MKRPLALVWLALASAHASEGVYLITDHGAKGDNAFDNSPILNALISGFGPEGGTILVPVGDFRLQSPVVVKNHVTIRGVNYGQRSHVDPTPPGVFGPAGGSKLILGAGVAAGLLLPAGGPAATGITIRDLAISGSDSAVPQVGIDLDRANEFTRISGVNCVSLRTGIHLREATKATVERCWVAECSSSLRIEGGAECLVADNSFGGQPGRATCDLDAQDRLLFTGNNVFPDGHTGLRLTASSACNISHNTFTGWYTGMVQIEGNMNLFAHNTLSAVRNGVSWPADPLGRDGFFGFVRLGGNDNVLESCTLYSWQPEGDCRIHCASGERNVFRNLDIGALGSKLKIFVNGELTSWTRITHSGVAAEIDLSGSPTARVTYDP